MTQSELEEYYSFHPIPSWKFIIDNNLTKGEVAGNVMTNVAQFICQRINTSSKYSPPSDTDVIRAAGNGCYDIVEIFLKYNIPQLALRRPSAPLVAAINEEVIEEAIKRRHYDIVKLLLERNAPISERAIEEAVNAGNYDMMKLLLEHKIPISKRVIERAMQCGNVDIIKLLLEYYVDLDMQELVNEAEKYNHHNVAKLLRNL